MPVRPRPSVRLTAGAALLAACATTAGSLPAQAVAPPATPPTLPAGIESLAGYVPVTSCDPHAKPGVTALGRLLVRTYPGTSYGIDRTCGSSPTSEHNEGRAIDWMVSVRTPARAAQANAVLTWLLAKDAAGNPYANARRLGVMYIIWNNKMWRAYDSGSGWREYRGCTTRTARSSDTTCHRDHIHISLSWEGAMRRTSFWTGRVAAPDYGPCRPRDLNWAPPYRTARTAPCPWYPRVTAPAGAPALLRKLTAYSGQILRRGSTGGAVRAVQEAVHTTADGRYGAGTASAVAAWQRAHGVPASGVMTQTTWRALLKAIKPVTPPVTTPVTTPANPLAPYRNTVLRYGSRGPAVSALQRALRVTPVSGWFGPVTRTAVLDFQRRKRLPVTGVVDVRTWRALGA